MMMHNGLEKRMSIAERKIASLEKENIKLREENNKLKDKNEETQAALCTLNKTFKFCKK